jgi:DNA-binding IclR family transcriptional regulator
MQPMPRTLLPSQPIRSLIDGLTCLREVVSGMEPIGSRDLSRRLGIPHTRVNRYLRTLAHVGLLQQTPTRKYIAGPALHVFAAHSAMRSPLSRRTVEVLKQLHGLGAIVAMGMLWDQFVCYTYHDDRNAPDADPLGQVKLWPATQSSIGMYLLAQRTDEELRQTYPDGPTEPYDSIDALLADLNEIRRQGYALLVTPQIACGSIAVGVGAPPLAAIAVLLNRREDADVVLARLRQAAAEIAQPFER